MDKIQNNILKKVKPKVFAIGLVFLSLSTGILNNVITKYINDEVSPTLQTNWRLISCALFLIVIFRKRIKLSKFLNSKRRNRILFFLVGFTGWSFSSILTLTALKSIKLGNITLIQSLSPIFTYIFSLLALKTKFNHKILFSILVSIYGVSVVASSSFKPNILNFETSEILALAGVAVHSISVISRKFLLGKYSVFEITFFSMLFASLTSLPILLFTQGLRSLISISLINLLLTSLTGISTAIGIITFTKALQIISPTLGSQIGLTKIIPTFIIGYLLFGETLASTDVIGGVILLSGVYLALRQKRKLHTQIPK